MLSRTPEPTSRNRPARLSLHLEALDVAAGVTLARGKDRPVVRALARAGEIGSWEVLIALSGATLLAGRMAGDERLARAGGDMLRTGLLAGLVKTTLKRTMHRTRPNVLMDEGLYARGRPGTGIGPWQSFPSGHAAVSVAVARAVARAYPGLAGLAYGGAGSVAAIQVLRGAHFPADVLAGALVGLAAEAVSHRAARKRNGEGESIVPEGGFRLSGKSDAETIT